MKMAISSPLPLSTSLSPHFPTHCQTMMDDLPHRARIFETLPPRYENLQMVMTISIYQ